MTTNPPAFPAQSVNQTGMTLLDYFAAKAMQAIMTRFEADTRLTPSKAFAKLADSSYDIAAAMLAERQRRGEAKE